MRVRSEVMKEERSPMSNMENVVAHQDPPNQENEMNTTKDQRQRRPKKKKKSKEGKG